MPRRTQSDFTLDLLVAEYVVGLEPGPTMSNGVPLVEDKYGTTFPVPAYSVNNGSAASLADYLSLKGYFVSAQWDTDGQRGAEVDGHLKSADTFAMALCLAALAAFGVKVPLELR